LENGMGGMRAIGVVGRRRRRGLVTVRVLVATFGRNEPVDPVEALTAALAKPPDHAPPGLSYAEICRRYDEDPDRRRYIDDLVAEMAAEDAAGWVRRQCRSVRDRARWRR
jgi:hypothetical protein